MTKYTVYYHFSGYVDVEAASENDAYRKFRALPRKRLHDDAQELEVDSVSYDEEEDGE